MKGLCYLLWNFFSTICRKKDRVCTHSWQMHTWSGKKKKRKNLEVRAICVAHRKLVSASPWLTRAAGDDYLQDGELSLHRYPGYGCSSALNLAVAEQGCRTSGNQRCAPLHHVNYSVHHEIWRNTHREKKSVWGEGCGLCDSYCWRLTFKVCTCVCMCVRALARFLPVVLSSLLQLSQCVALLWN